MRLAQFEAQLYSNRLVEYNSIGTGLGLRGCTFVSADGMYHKRLHSNVYISNPARSFDRCPPPAASSLEYPIPFCQSYL
jgi:hypothetical protein